MAHHNVNLILASQSPRRAALLQSAGYSFEVMAPDEKVEDSANKQLPPSQLVVELAVLKARHIVERIQATCLNTENLPEMSPNQRSDPQTIVLAADTIAHCRNAILGKPESRVDAGRMLRWLSGRKHDVLTGVCCWDPVSNLHREFLEVTTLQMDDLSDVQIECYLDSDGWRDKAGAFGYQDGLDWVHIKNGLASNVVGLPVERLKEWLSSLNR